MKEKANIHINKFTLGIILIIIVLIRSKLIEYTFKYNNNLFVLKKIIQA